MVSTSGMLNGSSQNYGTVSAPHEHSSAETRTASTDNSNTAANSSTTGANTYPSIRRSVHIAVPEEEDDNASIASCSTYSSTCSSTNSLRRGAGGRSHRNDSENMGEEDEDYEDDDNDNDDVSSRQLFWTYIALTPVLLSIWGAFAALILLLPSVDNDSIVRWGKSSQLYCALDLASLPLYPSRKLDYWSARGN